MKTKHPRRDIERDPLAFVQKKLNGPRFDFGVACIIETGTYKEMGYVYDLRPYLTRYVYKQHGHWQEIYALNRTNLRRLVSGRVDKILS